MIWLGPVPLLALMASGIDDERRLKLFHVSAECNGLTDRPVCRRIAPATARQTARPPTEVQGSDDGRFTHRMFFERRGEQ